MLRLAGIVVALFVLTACGQQAAKVGPSPSPVIAEGTWIQDLKLTGELAGQITSIVPDQGTQQTYCSGAKVRNGESWSDTFYANIDDSGLEWHFSVVVANFRGPGTYANKDVKIALQSADNSRAWLNLVADPNANQSADKVSFVIDRSMQSGTIDATLTSAQSGKVGSEHVTGTWNCRG